MSEKIIVTAEDIRRTLARVAHEIVERNNDINRLILQQIDVEKWKDSLLDADFNFSVL